MNKNLLGGLTSLMLPLASYGMAPMTYGAYQRKQMAQMSGEHLLDLAKAASTRKPVTTEDADDLTLVSSSSVRELIIIDAAVPDKQAFTRMLKPGVDVQIIDSEMDGLDQLERILAAYRGLDAVHLVSHAADGELQLGNGRVGRSELEADPAIFDVLYIALREGGDLLFYGCDLAATEKGEAFLSLIRHEAGVDVAASSNKTGNPWKGGDWELEIAKGDIETNRPFSKRVLQDFSSTLSIGDAQGKIITTSGFTGGYSNTKSYDVDGSGYQFRLSTSSVSNSALYCGFGYCSVNFGGALTDTEKLYIDFVNGASFDIDSLDAYSPAGNNTYVFTPDSGAPVNGSGFYSGFSTQSLNFTNIKRLTVSRSDGGDLTGFDIDNLVIKNARTANSDGTLTASGSVAEPVGLPSTKDTVGEAVDVFDFTLTDGGGGDGLSTDISQITLNVAGTTSDTVRGNITWRLNGNDASNVQGTYNDGADTITFSGLSISVADGANETYTVNAYYNSNTGLSEDETVILSVDGDTDLVVSGSGTQMASGQSEVTNGSGSTIDVVATELRYTTQPASSVSGNALATQPVVAATDGFGNTDVDFTETITLTEASAGTLSNNTRAAVDGVATFTGVTYTASADQQSFTLTANDQDGVGSNLSTVDANAVTSDVVATKLIFNTQPAPTTINSGVSTDFTTDPVIHAVDANDLLDTGYSTNIVLAVTDPNDGAVDGSVNSMSGTGDADGDGTTVTLTPSSGLATFTNLVLQYTNSGSSNSLALRATSGGLTATNSSTITSLVNNTPVIGNLSGDNVAWPGTGSTVSLDSEGNATVSDTELDALNGGNGDYAGATLAVQRAGGANANDVLGFDTGGALFKVSGSNLQSDGQTFAVFTNSGGVLAISVNSSEVTATTALVTDVVRRITYRNDTPTGDATVRFSLSDGMTSTAVDVTVEDTTAPSGHSVAFDDGTLDGTEALSTSFTFNSAEVGAEYSYTISSSGGGIPVIGGGTVASAAEQISGIDVSGLSDGTLTLSVTLTDAEGNSATAVTDTATLDTSAPSGQSVSFDDANFNGTEATAASFTFASAEVGADYSYTISSSGGGTAVTGSGTVASVAEQISGINISGLGDGTLTLSVVLTDTTGNAASAVTDTATLDATAPSGQSVSFDDSTIDETEVAAVSFTFAGAEVGAGYSYTISSNGGGTPVTGSGTLASASDQISGIDVSGLSDGTLTLSVTLSDVAGNGAGAVIDTATLDTNEAPVATNDTVTTNEDESVLINILANDTDSEDDLNGASVHVLSAPAHGMVRLQTGSGLLLYTPMKDYSGADSFTYSIEDARGMASGVATVALTINAVNDAPTAVADAVSTLPGQMVNIDLLANDSDRDDALVAGSVKLIVYAANGVADVSNGKLTYTPNDGFTGTEKLSYVVLDDAGDASNVADVFINVYAANQKPKAVDDTATVATNTPSDIDVLTNDTDVGGSLDPTSVNISQWPYHGTVSVNATTGQITYTPDSDFKGEDSFAYVVADNAGAVSSAAKVDVTVGAGEAPVARADQVRLVSDAEHRINVLGNDGDTGVTLVPSSVTVTSGPQQGSVSVDAATGDLLYTPDPGFSGTETLTYTVQDSNNGVSSPATVMIGQQPINAAPLANDDWQVVDEDSKPLLTLLANDADVDSFVDAASVVTLSSPKKGVLSVNGGLVTYTPDANAYGEDRFVYQVSDGDGAHSEPAVVRLRITPKAEVPRISGSPTKTVAVGNSYSFVPVAVDPNSQPLTFSILNRPVWATFDKTTGRLSGKPGVGSIGSSPGIVISVSNGDETAALPAFNLQVTDASGTSDGQNGGSSVGSSDPVSDDTNADLVVVDAADPKLTVKSGTWPSYTNDQPPRARYALDYVDQYGARHTISVTQLDTSASLPVTSGPDAKGRQTLEFGTTGNNQVVTIAPDGRTSVVVSASGSVVSTLTSRAADLALTVAANGQVTSVTTADRSDGGFTRVKLVQPASGGVDVTSTYHVSEGASGQATQHGFDMLGATIALAADGSVQVSGNVDDGGDTVGRKVRVEPNGLVSLVATRTGEAVRGIVARDPGSTSTVSASGVVTLNPPTNDAVIAAADNGMTYDSGTVASCAAVALTGGAFKEICVDEDPDLNGLNRAAEVTWQQASGSPLISRLEITDTDNGNESIFVEDADDSDGYVARRTLTDGALSTQVRLDGTVQQRLSGRSGLSDNVMVSLMPNNLSLMFNDRAVTVAENEGATFYLELVENGEVHHEVALGGISTQAISQIPGSRTVLTTNGAGAPEISTSIDIDGRQVRIVAEADGAASHRVINRSGMTTQVAITLAGTYSTVGSEGTVRSRVRLGETETCAWAESFNNGETNTGFGRYDEASARCVDIDAPTNQGSPFEAGNRVTIEGEGSNATITIETSVTRPIRF